MMQDSKKEDILGWESFWKENPTGFNATMAQSTLFFAKTLADQYPIAPEDHFLDIGCGPGFLISYLKGKCEVIHGTDISEKYIEIAKEQFKDEQGISFTVSKAYDFKNYQELIVSYQINRVIMLSVLQYYKSEAEVKNLVLAMKEIAHLKKFTCLLADIIPTQHSTIGDIFNIVKHAIMRGYTLKFVKFLCYAVFSDYRKIKKNGLLQVDETFFLNLKDELNLDIEIVKDLTIHTGRYSVLIHF